MILYITITVLINIGVGYWLAHYLGAAERGDSAGCRGEAGPDGVRRHPLAISTSAGSGNGYPLDGSASGSAGRWNLVGDHEDAARARLAKAGVEQADRDSMPDDGQSPAPQEPIDVKLLAGIEQFRSQLAQIRNQVEPIVPAAAAAAE